MNRIVRLIAKYACFFIPIVCCSLSQTISAVESLRPNVVFIAVDDLRPELGCYAGGQAFTPHLDAFAEASRTFDRHYVQVATCGASRFSMLTGQYPTELVHLKNGAFETLQARVRRTTLPEFLRRHGYYTACIGKISHSPDGRRFGKEAKGTSGDGQPEMPNVWDEVGVPTGAWKDGWSAFFAYANGKSRTRGTSPPFETVSTSDNGYPDGLMADAAVAKLNELWNGEQQFFLAVGFYKPHLPFCAPMKYWDLYDRQKIQLADFQLPPNGVDAKVSLHTSGEMFGNYGGHPANAKHNEDYARTLKHGYLAATSYVDAQIGKLLAELDRLDSKRETIVIIWGDHGWHLGDHGLWGKHTLHERALRSALMIRIPNMNQPGVHSTAIVESVSLFKTIAQLCGLQPPSSIHSESLVPQLVDPTAKSDGEAFSFWSKSKLIGYSVRTESFRATEWISRSNGDSVQLELYDHSFDANETRNRALESTVVTRRILERTNGKRISTTGRD